MNFDFDMNFTIEEPTSNGFTDEAMTVCTGCYPCPSGGWSDNGNFNKNQAQNKSPSS